ncbi:VOC family protein [Shimia sp. W99]
MTFIPYLTFDGTAEAAMNFYADVFQATEIQIMRYSDAPADEGLPASDRVMHAHIMLGDQCLMAADGMPGTPVPAQDSVSINHPVPSVAAGQAIFDKLSDGAEIIMPYGPTFYAPAFGMLRDKFGTNWMIGVYPEDETMPQ